MRQAVEHNDATISELSFVWWMQEEKAK